MLQVVPVGVVVVIIYCWEQLNLGGAAAQNPTMHTLIAVCPLRQWGGGTPLGTHSLSSLSHSTKSAHQRSAVDRCSAVPAHPPAAKRANTQGKGTSWPIDDIDDDGDKYDDDDDLIPVTDGPIFATAQDAEEELVIATKAAELVEKHCQEFMKRAFSVRALSNDVPLHTASAMIKMCRPQKDLDYIIHVLKNWQVCVNIKTMVPCPERHRIS